MFNWVLSSSKTETKKTKTRIRRLDDARVLRSTIVHEETRPRHARNADDFPAADRISSLFFLLLIAPVKSLFTRKKKTTTKKTEIYRSYTFAQNMH
jgi:hypothetical protein